MSLKPRMRKRRVDEEEDSLRLFISRITKMTTTLKMMHRKEMEAVNGWPATPKICLQWVALLALMPEWLNGVIECGVIFEFVGVIPAFCAADLRNFLFDAQISY